MFGIKPREKIGIPNPIKFELQWFDHFAGNADNLDLNLDATAT